MECIYCVYGIIIFIFFLYVYIWYLYLYNMCGVFSEVREDIDFFGIRIVEDCELFCGCL